MRILLGFCFAILTATTFAQPIVNRSAASTTVQDARLYAQLNFGLPRYTDTTQANLSKGADSSGTMIFTTFDNRIWKRAYASPKFWIPVGDNSGSTGLQSGGIVTWSGQGLKFYVTPAVYYIGGVRYQSVSDSVTLSPSNPSNPRIDVIGVNTSGRAFVLTGTPATNPAAPVIDFTTQVQLTTVLVNPGATTPGNVFTELIYDENVEWQTSSTTTTPVAFESLAFPFRNLKSAAVDLMDGDMIFTNTTNTFFVSDYQQLTFHIRLGVGQKTNSDIAVQFAFDGVPVSSPISLTNNPQYGYNPLTFGSYQNISIPISDFLFTTDKFDELRILRSGAAPQFVRVDYIQLQGGATQSPTNNFITDVFRPLGSDSVFVVQGGITRFAFRDSAGGGSGSIVTSNQLVKSGDTLRLRYFGENTDTGFYFDPTLGSMISGKGNSITAFGSSAIGEALQNPVTRSLVVGYLNDTDSSVINDVKFQVANNGNLFEVRGNGDLKIGNSSNFGDVLTDVGGGVYRPHPFQGIRTGDAASLQSLHITGTNGAGNLLLRHQASPAVASGQTSALFADNSGNIAWQNDNLHRTTLVTNHFTSNRDIRFQNKSYTVADSADVALRKLNSDSTGNSGYTTLYNRNALRDSLVNLISGSGWSLTGNSITAGNFIGSTNSASLRFRTNNTERMVLDSSGRLGLGTTSVTNGALVDLNSTTSGLLIPRGTTAQRDLITTSNNLLFGNTTTNTIDFVRNTTWTQLLNTAGGQTINGDLTINAANQMRFNQVTATNNSNVFQLYSNAGYDFETNNVVSLGGGTRNFITVRGIYSKTGSTTDVLNILQIRPVYSFTASGGSVTVRGLYYNPNVTSAVNTTEIAIETVRGDVLLGTTSGRVGIGTSSIASGAALDVTSTTGAVVFPRMTTTQRDAISSPVNGSVIYNTTTDKLQVRAAGAWVDLH